MDRSNRSYELESCLWELTLRCNMHCLHCGSVAGRARPRELTLSEAFAVADQLIELQCSELTLIGGEVFLYRGWERIGQYVSERGMAVNIMTNAYSLGEEQVAQIQYARLSNVGISIDGLEARHNQIRGKKDAFAHVVRAFDLLNRAHITIAAVTSLLELNISDLGPLYEFLLSHGVQIWQIQLVNPMGNMSGRHDMILDPARIPALIDFIHEKSCERRMIVVAADSVGYYFNDSEERIRGRRRPISYWEGCQAGVSSVFIDSTGNVKGCGALYDDVFIEGNLRHQQLRDIWQDEKKFAYNRAFKCDLLSGACHDCDVAGICKGGCRASNYFNTGKLYENAFCPRNLPFRPSGVRSADIFPVLP